MQNMNLVAKESLEEYMRFYHAMLEGVPQGSAMFKLRVKDRDDYAWIKAHYFLTYDKENIRLHLSFHMKIIRKNMIRSCLTNDGYRYLKIKRQMRLLIMNMILPKISLR